MNSLVIYFREGLGCIEDDPLWLGDMIVGRVRAELHENKDITRALDDAKPREGEVVLNAVAL